MFYLHFLSVLLLVKSKEICITVMEVEQPRSQREGLTLGQQISQNSNTYLDIIERITRICEPGVIIFPESTLDNVRKEKELKVYGVEIANGQNPCTVNIDNYPKFLIKISCAARQYDTIIIVNLIESDGETYYTSDVLFNRKGYIAFREHRIGVKFLNTAPVAFAVPPQFEERIDADANSSAALTPTSAVTGFSFSYKKMISNDSNQIYSISSNWISQLPFFTALQVYQMWVQEYNITLFVSSVNNPSKGLGGVAVFHNGLVFMQYNVLSGSYFYPYWFTNITEGRLGIPFLNKSIETLASEMDLFYLETDPDLPKYAHKLLNTKLVYGDEVLCYNHSKNLFCCNFQYSLSFKNDKLGSKQYVYHFVAYKGHKNYYDIFKPGGVEICAVIACTKQDFKSCGKRFPNYDEVTWRIRFENLKITAKFDYNINEKVFFDSQFPNSLLSSIRPIHPSDTKWEKTIYNVSKPYIERIFSISKPQDQILTFAIIGRNFTLKANAVCLNVFKPLSVYFRYLLAVLLYYC